MVKPLTLQLSDSRNSQTSLLSGIFPSSLACQKIRLRHLKHFISDLIVCLGTHAPLFCLKRHDLFVTFCVSRCPRIVSLLQFEIPSALVVLLELLLQLCTSFLEKRCNVIESVTSAFFPLLPLRVKVSTNLRDMLSLQSLGDRL